MIKYYLEFNNNTFQVETILQIKLTRELVEDIQKDISLDEDENSTTKTKALEIINDKICETIQNPTFMKEFYKFFK